jgi:hypothetical protein
MKMLSPIPDDDYDAIDMDALKRAMTIAAQDPDTALQLKNKLDRGEPWTAVAEVAAAHCQISALALPPWQPPPCRDSWLQGGKVHRNPNAAELLDEMLAAGISQWEPDPPTALRKAKRRR